MENTIYQIYDKIFKKILTLSSKAVINLINGLFETDYPLDSTIHYNLTEFVDDQLKHILADTILTINNTHSYHLEAQMTKDDNIIFRVFEFGRNLSDLPCRLQTRRRCIGVGPAERRNEILKVLCQRRYDKFTIWRLSSAFPKEPYVETLKL